MELKVRGVDRLTGVVQVPADKSILHRALILAALGEGKSRLACGEVGRDCESTRRALAGFGVSTAVQENGRASREGREIIVWGGGPGGWREPGGIIQCGNSGTTLRLLLGVAAGLPFHAVLTGDASLRRRPMGRVVKPLSLMGARISGRMDGSLAPLAVRGRRLRPLSYRMPIASAQVKSAVLLAGLLAEGRTSVEEPAPSRNHTELMLRAMGARLRHRAAYAAVEGPAELAPLDMRIPGDFSSAAFLLGAAAALPGSRLTLREVGLNPTRTGLLRVLRRMGARIKVEENRRGGGEPVGRITVEGGELHATEVLPSEIPSLIDELPLLAVVATQASGTIAVRGAGELRVKESDRISSLSRELKRLGARMEELPDGFLVEGGTELRGAVVRSHGDHRIALALAVAGLFARGETTVRGSECVDISYPGFAAALGALLRPRRRPGAATARQGERRPGSTRQGRQHRRGAVRGSRESQV